MGEDLGSALRSLSDPKSKGLPDTYMGDNWYPLASNPSQSNDYGGVHYNNGPYCHWFYLISDGGTGTNDTLAAATGGSTFTISDSANNAGSLTEITFTAIENLAGAAGDDTFIVK